MIKSLLLHSLKCLLPALLMVSVAQAQQPSRPKLQVTGDIVADTKANFGPGSRKSTPCDFNIFSALRADTVVQQIQQCVGSEVADAANTLLPDVAAALASAKAYGEGDKPAIACLEPGIAILKAAVGTPAIPEVAATATAPAAPAQPATYPGPILIFQKFREFQLSGGPAACKTWVGNTTAAAVLP